MTAYTESEKYKDDVRAAVSRYNAKQDCITVRVPKGMKKTFYDAAERSGMPFKQFFIQAMNEKIGRMDAGE